MKRRGNIGSEVFKRARNYKNYNCRQTSLKMKIRNYSKPYVSNRSSGTPITIITLYRRRPSTRFTRKMASCATALST